MCDYEWAVVDSDKCYLGGKITSQHGTRLLAAGGCLSNLITMKKLLFITPLILLTGCAFVEGERVAPDGSKLSIRSSRILWASQDMEFTTESDGVKVGLRAKKSSSDAIAVEALANIANTAIQRAP